MTKIHTVPAGTMTSQLVLAAQPSNYAYFDPADLVNDYLTRAPELHAKVSASMAWSIDNACINQARNVLFTRFAAAQEAEGASDVEFDDFCQGVAEDLAHESLYQPGEFDPPEYILAVLLAVREQWHDYAQSAAATDNRDYDPKTLRQLMESEKVREPDVGTIANHRLMIKLEANGDETLEARMLQSALTAERIAAENRVIRNKALHPVLLEILRTAKIYGVVENARFDQLPVRVQRSLTNQAINTLERSIADLASRLARRPIDFARTAESKHRCKLALENIMSTKFSDSTELESVTSQTQIDMNRMAKKRAMCDIG